MRSTPSSRRRRSSKCWSSSRRRSATSCSAIETSRSRNIRPTRRPPPRSSQAKRDLDHTVLRAPIAGMATQVASIQMGRYVSAGTPVFSLIDDARPWVDANPKETDITHLRIGQPVSI
jgi:multidrug resistance efflux pump